MDGLHSKSGIADKKVVNAHGTGGQAQCAICKAPHDFEDFDRALRAGTPLFCTKCSAEGKKGPIKPSVVFFNESLPAEFTKSITLEALAEVDLVLIMGTTLRVGPFNVIPRRVSKEVPQVLINNDIQSVRGADQFSSDG